MPSNFVYIVKPSLKRGDTCFLHHIFMFSTFFGMKRWSIAILITKKVLPGEKHVYNEQ